VAPGYDRTSYEQHAAEVRAFLQEHPRLLDTVYGVEIMTDEERVALFRLYCRECGRMDAHCQCWNDE
jgi:hypothetical protein